jgi:hypothetical protein
MKHVTLHFEGGSVVHFICNDIEVYKNGFGNFTKLTWHGADKSIHFDLNKLIAVEVDEGADE